MYEIAVDSRASRSSEAVGSLGKTGVRWNTDGIVKHWRHRHAGARR